MTSAQCREARNLLHWSREHLAALSNVPLDALITFERIGSADPEQVSRIGLRLAHAGVEFTDGGVRLKEP
jgi:hypothetical protein